MSFGSYCCVFCLLLSMGCGADADGSVEVTAYGESFIEDGIPESAFGDGWAVDFSRFEVVIDGVSVAGQELGEELSLELTRSSSGRGQSLGVISVPVGEHTNGGYTIAKVSVEGTATSADSSKSFSWVFDSPTEYTECETTTIVDAGGSATFQITVHADHLFYDSLVSPEPSMLFQLLADADSNVDGSITRSELQEAGVGAYDPGSESGVDNLWTYLSSQVRTLGHVDGEGHCRALAANEP